MQQPESVVQDDLTPAERKHLYAFREARPDWKLGLIKPRWYDEHQHAVEHRYPQSHPYLTGLRYTLPRLAQRAPCKALDIGSPLAQSVAAACLPGIEMTVLDVRAHDEAEALGLRWIVGTASALPFDDGSFDAVTSNWVLGHVGDGRYGDAFDVDGDRHMLAEIARVLRPGGTAIIGAGLIDEDCGNFFNMHRIYSWPWLEDAFSRVGFDLLDRADLPVNSDMFFDATWGGKSSIVLHGRSGRYGIATLRKR